MTDARKIEQMRTRLHELAKRRDDAQSIVADTRAAVQQARELGLSVTEIASRLGMDRSSLYRTYINEEALR